MTERIMPDEVFANIAADLELELERIDQAVDDEVRARKAEEAGRGHAEPS